MAGSLPEGSQHRVLIVGAEGGVGSACAQVFERASWRVFAASKSDLDVRSTESIERYLESIKAQPSARAPGANTGLDLVINCAAVLADAPLARLPADDFERVLDVNLSGAMRLATACHQPLAERQGMLIFFGSYSAVRGSAGQSAYVAAKAGLLGLTQSLARQWGPQGIRVNAVLPGFLETKLTRQLSERRRQQLVGQQALERCVRVQEVAQFLLALYELKAASGQIFALDSRF